MVILVTKAVGDFIGTRGIADESIRFNGYPILDQHDHSSNVAGGLSKPMTPCGPLISLTISLRGDEERLDDPLRFRDGCQ
jgi:hypothetical protein